MSTLAVANIKGLSLTASVNFYASPIAPTPSAGDSSNKLATTNFVMNAVGSVSSGFYFTLGSTTILSGSTVAQVLGLSLDASPIGQTNPALGTFTTLVSTSLSSTTVTSSRVLLGNGTLAAPSLAFASEAGTDSGLISTADGTFSLVSNGAEIARVIPGGMQLISTLSPTDNSANLATTSFVQNLVSTYTPSFQRYRNLSLVCTGSNSKAYLAAEEVILETPAGNFLTVRNLQATIDLTTTNLNGLDSGTVAPQAWYSIWAVSNGTTTGAVAVLANSLTGQVTFGSNVISNISGVVGLRAGMGISGQGILPGTFIKTIAGNVVTISTPCVGYGMSAATITLYYVADPTISGYTYKTRLGWICTNTSANSSFPLAMRQTNMEVDYLALNTGVYPSVSTGAVGTQAAVSILTLVPPTASRIAVRITVAGASAVCSVFPNSNANSVIVSSTTGTAGTTKLDRTVFGLESYGNIYVTSSGGTTTNIDCLGWVDSL